MPESEDEEAEIEDEKEEEEEEEDVGDVSTKEGEETTKTVSSKQLSEKTLSIHKNVILNTHPFYIGQPPFYTAARSAASYCSVSTTALVGLVRVHCLSLPPTHVHALFTQEQMFFTNSSLEQKSGLARGSGLASSASGQGLALSKHLSSSSSTSSSSGQTLRRSLMNISSRDCVAGEWGVWKVLACCELFPLLEFNTYPCFTSSTS